MLNLTSHPVWRASVGRASLTPSFVVCCGCHSWISDTSLQSCRFFTTVLIMYSSTDAQRHWDSLKTWRVCGKHLTKSWHSVLTSCPESVYPYCHCNRNSKIKCSPCSVKRNHVGLIMVIYSTALTCSFLPHQVLDVARVLVSRCVIRSMSESMVIW